MKEFLEVYEGWKHYRKYLNDPTLDKLRGNQINTWNGQWLTYKLGNNFVKDFDFARLHSENIVSISDKKLKSRQLIGQTCFSVYQISIRQDSNFLHLQFWTN